MNNKLKTYFEILKCHVRKSRKEEIRQKKRLSVTNWKLSTTRAASSMTAIGQWTSLHAPPDVCGIAHELTWTHQLFFLILFIFIKL
jgi:hypothetical protein